VDDNNELKEKYKLLVSMEASKEEVKMLLLKAVAIMDKLDLQKEKGIVHDVIKGL